MRSKPYASFRIDNDYLDDPVELERRFQSDGYLFFRDVLDLPAVLALKHDLVAVLQQQGVVKAGPSEPVWTGATIDRIDNSAL